MYHPPTREEFVQDLQSEIGKRVDNKKHERILYGVLYGFPVFFVTVLLPLYGFKLIGLPVFVLASFTLLCFGIGLYVFVGRQDARGTRVALEEAIEQRPGMAEALRASRKRMWSDLDRDD